MYKGGLIFGLVIQAIEAIAMIGWALASPTIFAGPIVTIYWVLGLAFLVPVMVSSFALNNLAKAESSEKEFNSSLALAAGIICLFSTFIAGILVLIGMNEVKNKLGDSSRRNQRERGRKQDNRRRDDYYDGETRTRG